VVTERQIRTPITFSYPIVMHTKFLVRGLSLLSVFIELFCSFSKVSAATTIDNTNLALQWTNGNGGWNTSVTNPWSSLYAGYYIASFTNNGSSTITVSGTNYLNGIYWNSIAMPTNLTIIGGTLVFSGTNSIINAVWSGANLVIGSSLILSNNLSKTSYANIILNGSNNFTNGTWQQLGGGTLVVNGTNYGGSYQVGSYLPYSSALTVNQTGKIVNAAAISALSGGSLFWNNTNLSQINNSAYGSTTISLAGGSFIYSASGSTNVAGNIAGLSLASNQNSFLTTIAGSSGTNVLNIGSITNAVNSTLQANLGSASTNIGRVNVINTNGLALNGGILPWAVDTFSGSFLTITNIGTNNYLGGYGSITGVKQTNQQSSNWVYTDNVFLAGSTSTLTNSKQINSLVLSNQTLSLGGIGITINSGGILSTGSGNTIITNGTLGTGSSSSSLYLWNSGTGTQIIAANIGGGGPGPGAISLIKSGSGITIFTGSNASYNGQTYINGGTLQIGNGGTNGNVSSAPIVDNGNLAINLSSTFNLSNGISGVGTLTQSGSGTTVITSTNNANGTVVNRGTLLLTNNGMINHPNGNLTIGLLSGQSGNVIISSGLMIASNTYVGSSTAGNTLTVSGSNSTLKGYFMPIGYNGGSSNNILVISNGGSVFNSNGAFIGDIGGSNKAIVTGTGSLFRNQNDLMLGWCSSSNNLIVSNGGNVIAPSLSIGYLTNGSGLAAFNQVLVTGSNSLMSNASIAIGYQGNSNSLLVGNGGLVTVATTYIGQVSNSTGNSLLVTGVGSLYSNSGNVTIGSQNGANTLTVANGGSLAVRGATSLSNNNTLNLGTIGGNDTLGSVNFGWIVNNGTINLSQANAVTLSNSISGAGSLNQLGSGTTIISGNNNYSGGTLVNAGTITTTSTNALGSSVLTLNGGTLNVQSALNLSSLNWSNGIIALPNLGSTFVNITGAVAASVGATNAFDLTGDTLYSTPSKLLAYGSGSISVSQFSIYGVTNYSLSISNNALWVVSTTSTNPAPTPNPTPVALNGNLYVGSNSSGVVTNFTSATNTYSNAYIGYNTADSNNLASVGSGVTLSNSNLYVGFNGSRNQLQVTNGGVLSSAYASIGNSTTASNNSVLVDGSNSTWVNLKVTATNTNPGYLYVGYGGSGNSLVISNGGVVSNSSGYIGSSSQSANNTVVVTGTNSYMSNSFLAVGMSGSSNSLVVNNGGLVTVGSAYIGDLSNSSGNSVSVSGAGSYLSNSMLYVGFQGNSNSLVVSNGGLVTSATTYIGQFINSTGNSLLITGVGSMFSNSGNVIIFSQNGANTLTVANGGSLSVGGTTYLSNNSTLNLGTYAGTDNLGSVSLKALSDNGVINLSQANALTLSNPISGAGILNQLGNGTTMLSGSNSFTGSMTITAGVLQVNGSVASARSTINGGAFIVNGRAGAVTINNGGTLSGAGSVGAVTVNGGGAIAPGSNTLPATLSLQSAIWAPGGNYNWVLADATGSAGTGYSTLSLAGTLDLSQLSSSNQFNINLTSLTANGFSGAAANFNPSNNYSWTLLTKSNGITGFVSNDFLINTNGFANTNGGIFGVSTNGNELDLTYTAPTNSFDTNSSNPVASDPFTNGLVLYYPFNGDFIDYSGRGNDLTNFTPGIAFASDRFGVSNGSLYFTTNTDSATTINPIGITNTGDRTVSMWIRTDGPLLGGMGSLISWGNQSIDSYTLPDSSNIGRGFQLFISDTWSGGNLYAWSFYGGLYSVIDPNTFSNSWHQVAYVYSGSIAQAQIYMDGVPLSTSQNGLNTYTNLLNTTDTPATIGDSPSCLGDNGTALPGTSISDLRVYNRALESNDVAALYALESGNSTLANLSQTITFPTIPNQTYGVGTIILNGYVSSGLAVTYTVPTGSASTSNNQLIVTGAGTVTVVANQLGDGNYAAAIPVTNSFVVSPANQFITAPQLPPITYGSGPINLASSAQPSGLGVIFSVLSGPATISNNVMNITGAGTVTLSESQSGNANYLPASNVTTSFVVGQATQSISSFDPLTNQPYPSNAMISITAPAASSGLPVAISILSGPASVAATNILLNDAGIVTLAADQSGNSNYLAATEVTTNVTITPVTITNNTLRVQALIAGQSQLLISTQGIAWLNAGPSAVPGVSNGTNLPTLLDGYAWYPIWPSLDTNYSYTGSSSNFNGLNLVPFSLGKSLALQVNQGSSNSVSATNIVTNGMNATLVSFNSPSNSVAVNYDLLVSIILTNSQSISFGALAPMVYGASPISLTATSSSYLPVSYSSSASNVASISGNVLTVMGAGSATITASQAGNSNWSAATPVSQVLTISKASGTVSFGNLNQTYDGTAKSVTVTTAPTSLGVAVSYNGSNAVPINAGSYTVLGSITNANYSGYGSNTLVISKASNVITPFSPIGNQTYSTNLMTVSVPTASSSLPVVLSVLSGPATLVGSNTISLTGAGTVVLAADQSGNSNYSAAQEVTTSFSVILDGAPSWIKPAGQGYVTTVIAQVLDTNGVSVTAPGSMLAAFNGTNVAGVSMITNGSSTFGMVVGAEQSSVSGMNYKVFNAQTGQVIPIAESLNFQSLVQQGTVSSPLTLHEISTQNIPINRGWNWISFNTLPVSNSINTVMANYQAQDNDVIKGVGGSATYFGGTWYPSPSTFTVKPGQMYMLSSQATTTLMVSGVPVASPMTISLSAGWNWIGCPLQSAEPITTFLNAVTAVNNDTLLTQGSFETYSAGSWYNFGGDFQLQPGTGFLLYVATPQQISF